jgi:hypothetical protein
VTTMPTSRSENTESKMAKTFVRILKISPFHHNGYNYITFPFEYRVFELRNDVNTRFIDRTDFTLRSGQGQDFFGDLKYFI